MKYVDVPSLFEGDRSHIAFLATYQFDPDFFERRLLRCSALQKARRIVVFVDRSEWLALLRRDIPARYVNRRYLVVPVQRSPGSFHPKLVLLLSESGGRVLCGSNNLTRAGCSSNLELLNAVCFEFDGKHDAEIDVAKEAFGFFEQAVKHTTDEMRGSPTSGSRRPSACFLGCDSRLPRVHGRCGFCTATICPCGST